MPLLLPARAGLLGGPAQTSPAASPQPSQAAAPDQVASPAVGEPPSPAPVFDTEEPEPLDLLSIAGGSVYKRLVPVVVGLVVIVGVVIYLVAK